MRHYTNFDRKRNPFLEQCQCVADSSKGTVNQDVQISSDYSGPVLRDFVSATMRSTATSVVNLSLGRQCSNPAAHKGSETIGRVRSSFRLILVSWAFFRRESGQLHVG